MVYLIPLFYLFNFLFLRVELDNDTEECLVNKKIAVSYFTLNSKFFTFPLKALYASLSPFSAKKNYNSPKLIINEFFRMTKLRNYVDEVMSKIQYERN